MTPKQRKRLSQFVDSAEASYQRLRKAKEIHHGKADNRAVSSSESPQAAQPKRENGNRANGTDSESIQNAIAAAVTLGVRRARATELARQCRSNNPGEILAHIMRNN